MIMTVLVSAVNYWLMMQEFQKEQVEPVRKMCDDTRRIGQALIQSAAADVSTADIEFNLQTLNTAWTTLSDRVRLHVVYSQCLLIQLFLNITSASILDR